MLRGTNFSPTSLGIFYMVISTISFVVMNLFVKIMGENGFSTSENVFYRGAIMSLFALLFMIKDRNKNRNINYKKGGALTLFMRAIIGGSSMFATFYNLETISIGTATAFSQTTAIYTVIIAMIFLHEKQSIGVIFSAILGFAGVIMICDPNVDGLPMTNIILGVYCGISSAIAYATLKVLKDYFDNSTIIFVFSISITIVSLFFIIINFPFIPSSFHIPTSRDIYLILGLGISGTFGQYYLTKAYTVASAGIVSPIGYLGIAITVVVGIFLGEIPSLFSIIGTLAIIISGILIGLPVLLRDIKNIKN